MIDQEIPRTIEIGIIPTKGIEATQIIEINDTKTIEHEIILTIDQIIKDLITTSIKLNHAIIHEIEIRTITIDKKTTLNHHIITLSRKNTRYPDSQNKYRSNTPKHQRQINQIQTFEEVSSDTPGVDNTVTTELQLNHINCESTDSESDTENAISVNMIRVENNYKPSIYEQQFHSHIYENHTNFLKSFYTTPRKNNKSID